MFGAVVDIPDEEGELSEEEEKDSVDEGNEMSDGEEGVKYKSGNTFKIMDTVTVRCRKGYVELEWVGNMLNDGIADATAAVLMGLETSPAAVRRLSSPSLHCSRITFNNIY